MLGNRSRDTGPELAVRRLLHAMGLRYRVDLPVLDGSRRRADIVFTRRRIAVFIDGCYWHGCPQHYTAPSANAQFWQAKVRANRQRDADTSGRLADAGWTVLRYWTHENPATVANDIAARVHAWTAVKSR